MYLQHQNIRRQLSGATGITLACLIVVSSMLLFACDPDVEDDVVDSTPTATPANEATPTPSPTRQPTPTPEPTPTPTPQPTPEPEPFKIRSSTPAHGAMAVPRTTDYTLLFNEPLTADPALPQVSLAAQDSAPVTSTDPQLSKDGQSLTYFGIGLDRDTKFTFTAVLEETDTQLIPPESWPVTYQAQFTTRVPCGLSYNIASDVWIEKLGANVGIVRLLNETLQATGLMPVAMTFDDIYTDVVFSTDDVTEA